MNRGLMERTMVPTLALNDLPAKEVEDWASLVLDSPWALIIHLSGLVNTSGVSSHSSQAPQKKTQLWTSGLLSSLNMIKLERGKLGRKSGLTVLQSESK